MKKVAIMQPYFFPYIGYFQLINSVDEFVIYDNIQYTKKGWINRNRILCNGKDEYITLPINRDSDYLDVVQRELSEDWPSVRIKLLNKIKESYRIAPYFNEVMPVIEACLKHDEKNLFRFILKALLQTLDYLNIATKITVSSELNIDHTLKSQDKVIEICKALKADVYINAIGGMELYDMNSFNKENIILQFIKSNAFIYKQLNQEFIPWLSIIDVMMFNSKKQINSALSNYTLI